MKKFYKRFAEQWHRECKPNGFEKQDIRLGGLIQRVNHCRERLKEYCEGKLCSLPELDENILPFGGVPSGYLILYDNWLENAMIKPKM